MLVSMPDCCLALLSARRASQELENTAPEPTAARERISIILGREQQPGGRALAHTPLALVDVAQHNPVDEQCPVVSLGNNNQAQRPRLLRQSRTR